MIYCSNCGVANRDGSRFCNECGQRIVEMTGCPACGFSNPVSGRFCNQCGVSLQQEVVPPAPADLTITSVLTAAPALAEEEPVAEEDVPRLDDLLAGMPDLAALQSAGSLPAGNAPLAPEAVAEQCDAPKAALADAPVEFAAREDEEIELSDSETDHFPLAGWADPHVGPFGAAAVSDLLPLETVEPSVQSDPDLSPPEPLPANVAGLDHDDNSSKHDGDLDLDLGAWAVPDEALSPEEVGNGHHALATPEVFAEMPLTDAVDDRRPLLSAAPRGDADPSLSPQNEQDGLAGEEFPGWLEQPERAAARDDETRPLPLAGLALGAKPERAPTPASGTPAYLSLARIGRASLNVAAFTAAPAMPELATAGALFAQVASGLQPVSAAAVQRQAKRRASTGGKAPLGLIMVLLLLVIVGLVVVLAVQGGFLRPDALRTIFK